MLAIHPAFRLSPWSKKEDRQLMIECKLFSSKRQTAFGPLCALGHYYLTKEGVLESLSGIEIAQKTVKHSPTQKLLDALVGILSGCSALYEIDCRVRPDLPLQRAFGRDRCADQSTISKTLNSFTEQNVAQLREAIERPSPAAPLGALLSRLLRAGDAHLGGGPHRP
jgi:hypothetical protein